MNTSKLFKLGSVLLVLMLALSAMSFAQQTWYVNLQTGLDGYNGLSATVTGTPGVGPKQTIGSAITASSAGDIISVDIGNAGQTYNEVITVTKKLTFTSTGGTPKVLSAVINNATASPNNTVTFTGPFQLTNGITLQAGAVIGAGNLTVGGTVTRYAISATASSTVDAQLLYTGTVNFVYQGGFAITTGLEMAPSTDLTTVGAITTSGASTDLTLNESKTMKGVLTTSGLLKLGGFTLTINGANTTHALGGAVSNGTLAFSMTGAATVATGAFAVPTVTASGAYLLTLTQATATGAVTANSSASITLTAATTTGNLTNNSSGTITATAATTVGAVTNASSGTVALTAATTIASINNSSTGVVTSGAAGAVGVTGNVINNGTLTSSTKGQITFASTGGVTIGGNLTNTPTINSSSSTSTALAVTNAGIITFADGPHTVTGTLTNSPIFTLSSTSEAVSTTATTSWTNNGQIRFATTATNLTFTGGIVVGPTFTLTNVSVGTGGITITGNGAITFASTGGNILGGGITISTAYTSMAAISGHTGAITQTGNGSILIASRTTGQIGA
ncbi:MAG: hypothetical protein HY276_03110, partial [Ignavibacteriales bacterium]|nr:hypothetical protein [Ignavibacteriales bacterium]